MVEGVLAAALPDPVTPIASPFSPAAYQVEGTSATILVLGPFTTLAAALEQEPDLARRIARVIVAGAPDPLHSWNLRADRAAFEAVCAAGVPMTFVVPLDYPTEVDDDEFEYESQVVLDMPEGVYIDPRAMRLHAVITPRGGDHVLDHDDASIKRPRRSYRRHTWVDFGFAYGY